MFHDLINWLNRKINKLYVSTACSTFVSLSISLYPIWSSFILNLLLENLNISISLFELTQTILILLLTSYMSFIINAPSKNGLNKILLYYILISILFFTIFSIAEKLYPNYGKTNDYNIGLLILSSIYLLAIIYIYYNDCKLRQDPTEQTKNTFFTKDRIEVSKDDSDILNNF